MPERAVDFLIVGGGDAGFSAARDAARGGRRRARSWSSRAIPTRRTTAPRSPRATSAARSRARTCCSAARTGSPRTTSSCSTRTSAMKLDPEAHTVTLANKDVVTYGKLLLATGANVRRLRIDGCDLDGIHYLRTLGNADSIRADTESAEHVVLVGGSYIATEVAATLTALGRKVHARDAGGRHARAHVRQDRRRLLPEGADRPRRRDPRRRGRRALRGRDGRVTRRRHQARARASRPTRWSSASASRPT